MSIGLHGVFDGAPPDLLPADGTALHRGFLDGDQMPSHEGLIK